MLIMGHPKFKTQDEVGIGDGIHQFREGSWTRPPFMMIYPSSAVFMSTMQSGMVSVANQGCGKK
jgi:hypothetical protein